MKTQLRMDHGSLIYIMQQQHVVYVLKIILWCVWFISIVVVVVAIVSYVKGTNNRAAQIFKIFLCFSSCNQHHIWAFYPTVDPVATLRMSLLNLSLWRDVLSFHGLPRAEVDGTRVLVANTKSLQSAPSEECSNITTANGSKQILVKLCREFGDGFAL